MSRIPPARTPNDRVRTHIKALIEETKHQAEDAPLPVKSFLSGMLSGLAASVEILDGGTAEKSLELMAQRLTAAIGQAYLDGKLPPQPPTAPDADRQLSREEEVRGVQAWMALDVHQALGWSLTGGEEHQGRKSWADWWAELCAEVRERAQVGDTLARVRELCELTIDRSVRVHAIDQARDTLAILDRQPTDPASIRRADARTRTAAIREAEAYNAAVVLGPRVSSPTDAMTAAGTPVMTSDTPVATALREVLDALHVNKIGGNVVSWSGAVRPGDYDRWQATLDATVEPRLLDCGLCYEEQGEEVHPHPECPIGTAASSPLRKQLATAVRSVLYQDLPGDMGEHVADAVLAVVLPGARITATLARDSEATVQRVIDVTETSPPSGVAIPGEWEGGWDAAMEAVRNALTPTKEQ